MYGRGISKTGELVDIGLKTGIIEKSGSWFSYNSQRIGQGRENAKQFLEQNAEVAADIETKIRAKAATPGLITAARDGGDDEADSDGDESAPGRKGRA
jgi:recombination protein RecA